MPTIVIIINGDKQYLTNLLNVPAKVPFCSSTKTRVQKTHVFWTSPPQQFYWVFEVFLFEWAVLKNDLCETCLES